MTKNHNNYNSANESEVLPKVDKLEVEAEALTQKASAMPEAKELDMENEDEIIAITKNGYIVIVQCLVLVIFVISLIYLLAKPASLSALAWMFMAIIALVITSIAKDD
jgi:putative copper export protein